MLLFVSQNGGGKVLMGCNGPTGSTSASWIGQGSTYTFYLYNASGCAGNDTTGLLCTLNVVGIAPLQPQVGMNKLDLLMQYYGDGSGCTICKGVAKRLAKKAILDAKYIGAGYLRIGVSDYNGSGWLTDSVNFWAAEDAMISDMNASGIKLVPSLMFNESQFAVNTNTDMHSFITNPNSAAYLSFVRFITKFINRYKNNGVIDFYELHNEINLLSDVDEYGASGNNPIYTNFTTSDLFYYNQRIAALIRSLDQTHMITSGDGLPRTSAEHLVIQSQWVGGGDFTLDNQTQFIQYLLDTHKYFDIVSSHTYNGGGDNDRFGFTGVNNAGLVGLTKRITDSANKFLYIGELGDQNPNSL